jgi:hypothetical protein
MFEQSKFVFYTVQKTNLFSKNLCDNMECLNVHDKSIQIFLKKIKHAFKQWVHMHPKAELKFQFYRALFRL